MPFFYKAFGLDIKSDFYAGNWLSKNSQSVIQPNLSLILSPIKNFIPNHNSGYRKHLFVEKIDDNLLFVANELVKFLMINTQTIIIEPNKNADLGSLQTLLFSFGMMLLLQKMGFLIIHGCSIEHNNYAYLFLGDRGAGKSSLALAFYHQGYRIAADDLCAVKTEISSFALNLPSYPSIKLTPETAEKLHIDTTKLQLVHPLVKKYFFPLQEKWQSEPLPVKHICILNSWENNHFDLQMLKGMEKIIHLKKHMPNFRALDCQHFRRQNFERLSELIANTPISLIKRPNEGFLLQELVEFIKDTIMA